jgi:hypothetical protein
MRQVFTKPVPCVRFVLSGTVTSATKPAESLQADEDAGRTGDTTPGSDGLLVETMAGGGSNVGCEVAADGDAGRMGDAVAGTGGLLVETTTVGGSRVGCEVAVGLQAERISAARTNPINTFTFITIS